MRSELDESAHWNIPSHDEFRQITAQHGVSHPPCLRVQELNFTSSPAELFILSFMRRAGIVQDLHRLCVKLYNQDGLLELAKFLEDSPGHLEHVRVYLIYHLLENTSCERSL